MRVVICTSSELVGQGLTDAFLDSGVATDVARASDMDALGVSACFPPDAFVIQLNGLAPIDLGTRLLQLRHWAPRARLVLICAQRSTECSLHEIDLPEGTVVLSLRSSAREVVTAAGLFDDRKESPTPPRPGAISRRPALVLTTREKDVIDYVSQGYTTAQISMLLGISAKTIDNHKRRIFAKLGVQNQAHAVSVAVRTGMIRPAFTGPRSAEVAHAG